MYRQLLGSALCVCLLSCLIDCQAPVRGGGAVHENESFGVDAPAEPVLIEKEEMEEMGIEEEHENQRKLEEEDEVVNHERDEDKREAKKVDGMNVQVNSC